MTPRMWIERRVRANGYEPGDPLYRVTCVTFDVMQEGEYWPRSPKVATNLRPVVTATLYPEQRTDGLISREAAQVSWPSTSDKRPELAYMLGHALQFAALEARVGKPARVFHNGGYFEPSPTLPAVAA